MYLLRLEVYPVREVAVGPHAVLDLHTVLSDDLETAGWERGRKDGRDEGKVRGKEEMKHVGGGKKY
jgi:hypothetical protein